MVPETQPENRSGTAPLTPPEATAPLPLDAYPPAQVAAIVESVGVKKAELPIVQTAMLGLLAGAFIAFGAMFYSLTITGSTLGFGPTRLLGGVAFSLGLVLVVVAGAELFTGNNLIVMAWVSGKITLKQVFRNWGIVYLANAFGAAGCAVLFFLAGGPGLGGGALGETTVRIAEAKAALPLSEAFFLGILCNTLVCMAVWLCMAAREVVSKVFAIVFPISAFVALGFEHSVANFYFFSMGTLAGGEFGFGDSIANLAAVTLGNVLGGGSVALVYWICYLQRAE
ncbi:formate/nitrite transporter family protein [Limibacillus halophilus]|uniref:Formate/nitrite transporter n=1 Tax=Limibacillus halophilus TaxID=1579333 RepID=A0A839SXH1_9PROT|nr:formate/nitrite transporter family protein [Limibacillus halophilus]MBB3065715.1 formate/nitrite transporter [Limibacillus halophilus]